jgi:hypothetical protein
VVFTMAHIVTLLQSATHSTDVLILTMMVLEISLI